MPTRAMEWGIRHCPLYLEPVFIFVYTLVFFVLTAKARQSVCENLRNILPSASKPATLARAFRVFWNFAWTCADAARVRMEGDIIDWEIVGIENFDQLSGSDGGAVLLTAHMGNYDVAAPVFARRFKSRIHAVRAPERNPELQAHLARARERLSSEHFQVQYNTGENFLGVDLVNAITAGEIVALQGDRMLPGLAPVTSELFGSLVRLPKGPFALALATKAPIYPVFIIRLGRRRYQVRIDQPFDCRRDPQGSSHAIQVASGKWAASLSAVIRRHWHQWYVFESVFPES